MQHTQPHIVPVILAGGSGTRLWPISQPERPKHLLPLLPGGESLLAATLRRVASPYFAPPCIVTRPIQYAHTLPHLPARCQVILEPEGRNTAAAILAAALHCGADDTKLLILPADHYIEDAAMFRQAVFRAQPLVEAGYIVTFGVEARMPETDYGYIRKGAKLGSGWQVAAFKEKPDRRVAESYLTSGDYVWNAGIFFASARTLLAEARLYAPELHAIVTAGHQASIIEGNRRALGEIYTQSPAIPFDRAVMEHTQNAAVTMLDTSWSDIGSWQRLALLLQPDEIPQPMAAL